MARKARIKKIELISKTSGVVKEYNLDHATRILRYQEQSGLGNKEIYNTLLYTYDQGAINIRTEDTATQGHSTDRGEPIEQTISADVIGEDQESKE
jgi:hypothetical protein